MAASQSSWQMTEEERRKAYSTVVQVASSFLGPFGPVVMWGFDYLYDRRGLIFSTAGEPVQAIASDGSAIRLPLLSRAAAGPQVARPQATLAIGTTLGESARRLGLRNGDPVSMLVTGHSFAGVRSGLVVPTRIGEQAKVSVPAGTYSVAAFGARQAALFGSKDPYQAAAGNTTVASGSGQLALSLAARAPLLRTPVQGTGVNRSLLIQAAQPQTLRRCIYCGQVQAAPSLLGHTLSCPSRPKMLTRSQLPFFCDRCGMRFGTANERSGHMAAQHPLVSWWRSVW